MSVTVTSTESWGSRLGGAFKGILFGLGMFIAGFPVLFWNEGRTVKTRTALEEGAGACIEVESNAKVDPEMDGELVHMSGLADTKEVLRDEQFGVSSVAISLCRTVEMYQWNETSHTTEKKNMGGSVTTTTTYNYEKGWYSRAIDSSSFHEEGHDNPGRMDWESDKLFATEVTFGAFRLNERQIRSIGRAQALTLPADLACPVERVQISGSTIYVPNAETRKNPLNERSVASQPRIGDQRISYSVVVPHEISLVAKQKGSTFTSYKAKNGKLIALLEDGVMSPDEMFESAQSANTIMCWVLRLVGFLLMYWGLSAVLRPLSVLADVLPILGTIIEIGTNLVAGLLAFVCALVTIAIAWLFYRPVLSCVLLGLAAGAAYLLWQKKRTARREA